MKLICLLIIMINYSILASSQQKEFPNSWVGRWKGELLWYKGVVKEPQKVAMELNIQPTGSMGQYSWQIIYGTPADTADVRPYTLIAKDTAKAQWVIDENNGIVLDQFWIANKFCGVFTVGTATILNNYWIENGKLMAEFYSISAKPIASTGKGTEESPSVDSYKIGSYQKATLTRQ
jgi:hypothetical protein